MYKFTGVVLFCGICIIITIAYLHLIGTAIEEKPVSNKNDCTVLERIPTEDGIIEIVNDECKEGLPHTTDSNTIRMTRKKYESRGLKQLLIHERVHLDQKRSPEKWQWFYKQYWDYDIQSESPIPAIYTQHMRPNPDTESQPWAIWRQRYVFFPYAEQPSQLKNAAVRIWDILENRFVPAPEQWKARFCDADGCPYQYEHPHEISAEFIANTQKSVAANQLRHWFLKKDSMESNL